MSHRWRNVLLSLPVALLLFASCSKKFSSDNPLVIASIPSVIISSDNNVLYGINPQNGQKNWSFGMPNITGTPGWGGNPVIQPSPLLYNEVVYMASACSDTIYKLNSATGTLIKKITMPYQVGFTVQATPIADANLIYIATTNDTLYAIDTGTYAIKWKFGSPTDMTSLIASPTIYNGNVYIASVGGHVFCLNKTTGPDASGNPIWDYPGQGVTAPIPASFTSSPAIDGQQLYIGSVSDSNLYAIYINPAIVAGVVPTTAVLHNTFKTGGKITSSPTTVGGFIYFGSWDFSVYCIDSNTIGSEGYVWRYQTTSSVGSSPVIQNNVLYIGSYDYNLYALNLVDGRLKWGAPFKTKGLIKSSPVPYNGEIYVGSYDNYMYAVDSATGTLRWQYYVGGNIECSPVIDNLNPAQNTLYNSGVSGYIQ